ncbi:hypothetical protein ACOMHN_012196 [Nucella lapillus]
MTIQHYEVNRQAVLEKSARYVHSRLKVLSGEENTKEDHQVGDIGHAGAEKCRNHMHSCLQDWQQSSVCKLCRDCREVTQRQYQTVSLSPVDTVHQGPSSRPLNATSPRHTHPRPVVRR